MWFLKPIQTQEFSGAESFSEIRNLIISNHNRTSIVPLDNPSDCNINSDSGLTVKGFRFNVAAFQQMCQNIASGLYSVLFNLWSDSQLPEDQKNKLLLNIYRSAIQLSGRSITKYKFVVDFSKMEIVGVVGRKYKFVPNTEIIKSIQTYFNKGGDYVSIKATMRNRDLQIVAIRKGMQKRLGDIEFRQGVAIFNSETTRQAIYLPQLVFDSQSKSYSMEAADKENRLIHRAKKRFSQILAGVIDSAIHSASILDKCADNYTKLSRQVICDRSNTSDFLLKYQKSLQRYDITSVSASDVVNRLKTLEYVTHWDLYKSLVISANTMRSSERQLRLLAFEILNK